MAGTYQGPDRFELSYVDGDASYCPTALRLQGKRQGGPDVDVILGCNAAEGKWIGLEPSPFGGPFVYEVTAQRLPDPMDAGPIGAELAASMTLSDTLATSIFLPPGLVALGKAGRIDQVFTLVSGKAAPCICQRVREELEHVETMAAAYGDPDILRYAQERGLLSDNPRGEPKWTMDDDGHLTPVQAKGGGTYEDLVLGFVEGSVTVGGEGPGGQKAPAAQESSADTEPPTIPKSKSKAYATTDSTTCKITMPDPAKIGASCDPAIVVQATYLHESVHAAECAARNGIAAYVAPDGTRIDRASDIDMFGYANGVIYPLVPFSAWLLRPENTSRTEVAAYTTEARMLRDWLAGNCSG